MSCAACNKTGRFRQIINGWSNLIFPNPEIEKIAKSRALVCATCDYNKINICMKCSCPIPAKTHSMESECELKKWRNDNYKT